MIEMDSSSRARVLHASPSPCLRSSVCPNTAYSLRRDAWLLARNTAAAAVLQAAVRVLSAHAFVRRCLAAELLQRTWRQHDAMAVARACGGKAACLAAVKIQSSWRGHWLRVKKVRLCACVLYRRRQSTDAWCVLQERALKKARAAWGEDDMDDDLEDIMASLKVPSHAPRFLLPACCLSLFIVCSLFAGAGELVRAAAVHVANAARVQLCHRCRSRFSKRGAPTVRCCSVVAPAASTFSRSRLSLRCSCSRVLCT